MAEDIVIEEPVVSSEDQNLLDQDLIELGEKPQVVVKEETPEEEEDRKEDELHQDKTPEEREAIRERRRNERQEKKRHVREKEDSYKREIDSLRRQLEEVNTWKNTVEHRNVQSGVAQIDKAISDANEALQLARQAMAQATQEGNGEAAVDATELYYAARKRAEDLARVKQTVAQKMSQRPKQPLDQTIARNAQNWTKDKNWYDPSGRDPDSRVVLTVDNMLAEEGWDPRQPEYWQELDTRLKKYMPHRFANSSNGSYTGGNSSNNGGNSRPPTEGSSSTSRPSAGYRLSPDRVKAIREAGAWEDPTLRREMIKAYMDYDKQSR
jgi:hypothetical protein